VLAVLLVGSSLIKTLHLFVSPDSHHVACHSEASDGDCAVCHFTFSSFITQQILTVEKPRVFSVEIASVKEFSAVLQKNFSTPSLRAPPFFI
jgi:hypothetical protein